MIAAVPFLSAEVIAVVRWWVIVIQYCFLLVFKNPCTVYCILMKLKYVFRIVLIGILLHLSIFYFDGVVLIDTGYGFFPSFALLVAVFGIVELLIYPILKMFILPLRIITFGLASVVLSVNIVYGIALLIPFFSIASFWQAAVVGFGLGVVRLVTR